MKDKAYAFCQRFVEDKIQMIQQQIVMIRESLNSESKRTAGDKHETGRAMLQLEREKLGRQLYEAEKMKMALQKVTFKNNGETITMGSLVATDSAIYFIAISAGKCKVDSSEIFCISLATPLAQLLLGKKVGDCITLNNQEHQITRIW